MKSILLLLPIFVFGATGKAQGVFSNQTNFILEKVVQEYASQFSNIKGDRLSSAAGGSTYSSTLAIPGAVSTVISEAATAQKKIMAWQSVLYSGTEFSTAKGRFETLFDQIKNTIIKPVGEKPVIVNGLFQNPSADKLYNTIQFDMLPAGGSMQKLNIDLILQHEGSKWLIVLSVSDKERTDAGAAVVVK